MSLKRRARLHAATRKRLHERRALLRRVLNSALPVLLGSASLCGGARATDGTWGVDGNGDWADPLNWNGGVPGAAGDKASFVNVASTDREILLLANRTIGHLIFDDDYGYSITYTTAPKILTLSDAAGASILVDNAHGNGAHFIKDHLNIVSPLTITNRSAGTFTLWGSVTASASVTFDGPGTTSLRAANTFTAPVHIRSGTVKPQFKGLGAAPITVFASATLDLEAGYGTGPPATFTNDLTLSGSASSAATLRFNYTYTTQFLGTLNLEGRGTISSIADARDKPLYLGNPTAQAGAIMGSGTLVKSGVASPGSAQVILALAAAHTGGTSLEAGLFTVTNRGSLVGTGLVTVHPNAQLQVYGAAADSVGDDPANRNSVSPHSVVLKGGALTLFADADPAAFFHPSSSGGALLFGGNGTFTAGGANLIDLGAIPAGQFMRLGSVTPSYSVPPNIPSSVVMKADPLTRLFRFGSSLGGSMRVSAVLGDLPGGSVGLDHDLGGGLQLEGANTYSGVTTIHAGRVEVKHAMALGSGSGGDADATIVNRDGILAIGVGITVANEKIVLNGGGLSGSTNGPVVLRSDSRIFDGSFGGVISGDGDATFVSQPLYNPFSVTFNNDNTFTGSVVVDGPNVRVSRSTSFGPTPKAIYLRSGTLTVNAPLTAARVVVSGATISGTSALSVTTETIELRTGTLSGCYGGPTTIIKDTFGDAIYNHSTASAFIPSLTVNQGRLILGPARVTNVATITLTGRENSMVSVPGYWLDDTYNKIYLNGASGMAYGGALATTNSAGAVIHADIDLGSSVAFIGGKNPLSIYGRISGSGMRVVGGWTVSLTGTNFAHTGATIVGLNGLSAKLSVSGRLSNTSSIVVDSGTFSIGGGSDMLPDTAPIVLNGGEFGISGAVVEAVGAASVQRGANVIALGPSTNSATTLVLASLSRSAGTMLDFTISSGTAGPLGGTNVTAPKIMFQTPPIVRNGLIGGWAKVSSSGDVYGIPDFAAYDSTYGVRALSAVGRPSDLAVAGSLDNVLISSATTLTPVSSDITVNSVNVSNTTLDLNGYQLKVNSGGILGRSSTISNGRLTAGGTSTGSAVLYLSSLTVNAGIVDDGTDSALSVVINGSMLAGANSYGGATHVVGARITTESTIASPASLPATTDLFVDRATLTLESAAPYAVKSLTLRNGAMLRSTASSGLATLTAGSLVLESGSLTLQLTGDGPMVKNTIGTATVQARNTAYFGAITINDGILVANETSAYRPLGTGPVTINGGRLVLKMGNFDNPIMLNGGALAPTYHTYSPQSTATHTGALRIEKDSTVLCYDGLYSPAMSSSNLVSDDLALNGAISFAPGVTLKKDGPGVLTVNGPISPASGATLWLHGGTTVVNVNLGGAAGTSSAALNLSADLNSLVLLKTSQRLGRLSLSADAVARLAGSTSASRALSVADVDISGDAVLDLADGALVVDYDQESPYAQINAFVDSARHGGLWNRGGITSSTAKAEPDRYVLAVAEASEVLNLGGSERGIWQGMSVDASSLLIRCTIMGDANLDGAVNFFDLTSLAAHYGSGASWAQGDFNSDGIVNFFDLTALAANYGGATPAQPITGDAATFQQDLAAAFALPEPDALALLTGGGLALLCRRRRSRPRARRGP